MTFTTPIRDRPLASLDDNKPWPLRSLNAKPAPAIASAIPALSTDKAAALPRNDAKRKKKPKASSLCLTPPSFITDQGGQNYQRGLCIGEGGFARCFQVRNGNDEIFAAKTVAKAALLNVKTKEKLLTEIDIHRQLSHPNLVNYVDSFEDQDNVYMLLEMCSNRSLADLVHHRVCLTETEARFWFVQMLGAVGHMHQRNVVHRDLKLGNIFLDKDLNIKVGDFGLAAVVSSNRRRYTVCGTPNYISPEVLNRPHCHSMGVDIWALGIILYSMLVGRPPFQDRSVDMIYERIKRHETGFPPAPSAVYQENWNKVSTEAREFISSMLNPDPSLRPTFRECLENKWITSGPFPSRIPISARKECPTFLINKEDSIKNHEKLLESTHLSPTSDVAMNMGTVISRASRGAAAAKQPEKGVLPHHISPPNTKDKYKPVAMPEDNQKEAYRQVPDYDSPVVGRRPVARETMQSPNVNRLVNQLSYQDVMQLDRHEHQQRQHQPPKFPMLSAVRTSTTAATAQASTGNPYVPSRIVPRFSNINSTPRLHQRPVEATNHRDISTSLFPIIRASVDNLTKGLTEFTKLPEVSISSQPPAPSPVVVTRWADFEESWGISYCLSDGAIGMLFRDGSSLRCDPLLKTFTYFETRSKPGYLTTHRIHEDDADPKRAKKLKVMSYVREYMDRELAHAIEFDRKGGDVSNGETLHFIQKIRGMIMFIQTNGTVQFNFRDHTKLIVHDQGKSLAFITENRQLYSCTLETTIRAANSQYWKRYNFIEKINTIKDILQQISKERQR